MSQKLILEKKQDGIYILTFNRPEALNALDLASMDQFYETMHTLKTDDDLRVLVLTGAGIDAFCSGGDLYDLSKLTTEREARDFITIMGDALLIMEHLPVPVIGAINGYALGGGSEIAVACDMRIVDDKARMGFVQVRLAVTPGWGAGQRLMRLVGYPRAMDILLHGHVMRAPELKELGLANKVVDEGKALEHALYFAQHIVENSHDVVRSIKELLRAGLDRHYLEALQIERDLFPPLWAAEPHMQAVEKFLQRQKGK